MHAHGRVDVMVTGRACTLKGTGKRVGNDTCCYGSCASQWPEMV